MARTTAEILLQLEAALPSWALPLRPVLAGIAAQVAQVEATGEALVDSTTVEGAEGVWLTLLAKGYGVHRSTAETDATVRLRLQAPPDQLTRPAVLDAANALLAALTATEATMIEPWDDGFADRDAWADRTILCDQHNSFVLVLPLVGEAVSGSAYLDRDAYMDFDFAGSDGEHPVYEAIRALINDLRAAGVRFWIHIEEE